ncbi:hypothetical protein P872_00090 [Rhodonellum psychrophilum GCM71 = DSM 17998]|uniref:Uncharacterized protein n=1 Tax=Rhodonellum psychrophilum GCM71 = DSM 17998 TaxID=1123057 RepID=U5C127_9BACT|nr:hypothetical protein P872_00090 [Rhodonellum psychrophilum GCM71 = DSM 17998]
MISEVNKRKLSPAFAGLFFCPAINLLIFDSF